MPNYSSDNYAELSMGKLGVLGFIVFCASGAAIPILAFAMYSSKSPRLKRLFVRLCRGCGAGTVFVLGALLVAAVIVGIVAGIAALASS